MSTTTTTTVLLLFVASTSLTCGHYHWNYQHPQWVPSYGCLDWGCSTQEGCVPWNSRLYPCYATCTYNRCRQTGPNVEGIVPPPTVTRTICYRITNLGSGKSLASSEVFDPALKMRYATVISSSSSGQANDTWYLPSAYGGWIFIQNSRTMEYLKTSTANKTYLAGNMPLDPSFQFRPVMHDRGWSRVQLQSACDKGYLYIAGGQNSTSNNTLVQITFNPTQNYYETLWSVDSLYC